MWGALSEPGNTREIGLAIIHPTMNFWVLQQVREARALRARPRVSSHEMSAECVVGIRDSVGFATPNRGPAFGALIACGKTNEMGQTAVFQSERTTTRDCWHRYNEREATLRWRHAEPVGAVKQRPRVSLTWLASPSARPMGYTRGDANEK